MKLDSTPTPPPILSPNGEPRIMPQDITASINACAAHCEDKAAAVRNHLLRGQAKALALPNLGLLGFDAAAQASFKD